jgi:hypothetical protein
LFVEGYLTAGWDEEMPIIPTPARNEAERIFSGVQKLKPLLMKEEFFVIGRGESEAERRR